MPGNDGILFAYEVGPNGAWLPVAEGMASEAVRNEGLAWVHMDVMNPATRAWLEREVTYLDKLILDALLAPETRPRMLEFDNGLLLIMRGVSHDKKSKPEDMVSIRMWIDPIRIITVRRAEMSSIQDMREKIDSGRGPKNAGDFLSALCTTLFEKMEPVLQDLDKSTDGVEEKVMQKPDVSLRQKIVNVRKKAIILRRFMLPQRDVIAHLRVCGQEWLEPTHLRRLQESYDRITRYVEDLDAIRERSQIVKDELANALSDRLNQHLFLLSLLAGIFMPLTFFTGLLGMNVEGIPFADSRFAFAAVIASMVVVFLIQLWIFRKLKWI